MRTLTLAASQQLAKQLGVEPVVLLQIEIPNSFVRVADKDINRDGFNWLGKIISLGNITSEQRTDLVGSVASMQVSLDDADGVFRNRLNIERWQSQKVKIFHAFQDSSDTFLIFAGKVSTPFNWTEDGHTLNFEAVSDFTSQPSGVELVDDQFEGVVPGGGIPLAFGTIVNSCPTLIYKNVSAKVATPFVKKVMLVAVPESAVYASNNLHTWANSPFQQQYGNYLYISNGFYVADSTKTFITGSQTQLVAGNTFDVDNANAFPQDTEISLATSNFLGKLIGTFHGNTFTVSRIDDLLKTLQKEDITDQSHSGTRPAYVTVKESDLFDYTYSVLCFNTKNSLGEDQQVKCYVLSQDQTNRSKIYLSDDPPEVWTTLEVRVPQFNPDSNIYAPTQWTILPSGAEVYLDDNGIIEAYAFTAMPYTNLKVLGYQIVNGKKFLCELPSQFYALIPNFQGLGITAIALPKKLSSYKISISGQNFNLEWGENFYVSFQSSVGSNVADIIQYIFQTYTNFAVDSTSFATVHTLVDKYPLNFVVKGTPEVITLIAEICYQSRLGLTIKNGLVYLKYLSKEPVTVAQITDGDILENTMEITFTDESKIKTQLTAKYEYDCVDHLVKKSVFKNNVDIYGLIKEEKTYFVTNNADLIQKSNTFWGYRISNQWKLLKFKTLLTTLAIEQGDCIEVISEYYTGKAIVDNYQYDSAAIEVDISLWTPVIAGTNVQSPFAWLSDTADIKPEALTIYAPVPQTYIITLPISNYGEHSRNSLTGTITGDEDHQTAPYVADDGTTGIATNLNEKAKVKAGDKIILVKDKFGKYAFQAPGGGGGAVPVNILFVSSDGVSAIVDVYEDGFDKAQTKTEEAATLLQNAKNLVTPMNTFASLVNDVYVIDLGQVTYSGTVTSGVASDGTFRASIITANGSTKSVTVTSLGGKQVKIDDTITISLDGFGNLSHESAALAAGNFKDVLVVDGYDIDGANFGKLSDVHRVSSDGKLTLDLDKIAISTGGGVSIALSDIFQIINGKVCLKITTPMTDGTNVAAQDLTLDTSVTPNVYRPSNSFVSI